jgi:hypothetical protein
VVRRRSRRGASGSHPSPLHPDRDVPVPERAPAEGARARPLPRALQLRREPLPSIPNELAMRRGVKDAFEPFELVDRPVRRSGGVQDVTISEIATIGERCSPPRCWPGWLPRGAPQQASARRGPAAGWARQEAELRR